MHQPSWMGRPLLKGTTSPGAVDRAAEPMAHQPEGDRGGKIVVARSDEAGGHCPSTHGLQGCRGLREQAGRHQIKDPMLSLSQALGRSLSQAGLDQSQLAAERRE